MLADRTAILTRLSCWLLGRRSPTYALGRTGERAAAKLLRRAGYRVIARNAHVGFGEADIICIDPDRRTIVLVEVKSRVRARPGVAQPPPEASVHARKRRKLRSIARHLARANRWEDRPLRIDVIAVEFSFAGRRARVTDIRHHRGAVTPARR